MSNCTLKEIVEHAQSVKRKTILVHTDKVAELLEQIEAFQFIQDMGSLEALPWKI